MQIKCSICGKKCTVVPSNLRIAGTAVEDYKCRECWNKYRLSIINNEVKYEKNIVEA